MGFVRSFFLSVIILCILLSGVLAVSFTTPVDLTPNNPTFKNDLSCSWIGSGDVSSATLYWYRAGVLHDTITGATSPQTIGWKTTNKNEEWNCSVMLTDGVISVTDWDLVVTDSLNYAPSVNTIEYNDASDSGDENITIGYVSNQEVRCFGSVSDINGNHDIESMSAVLYHSTSTPGDIDDPTDHYTVSSCSFTYGGDYECITEMTPESLAGTWTCQVSVSDQSSLTGTNTDTVTVYKISPPDNPPNVTSIEFNDVGDDSGDENITLPLSGTHSVRCFGYADDADGNIAITNIEGVFWHSSVTYSSLDDTLNHYTDSSCSYSTSTGYYECNADLEFYAENGTWTCRATATDNTSLTDYLEDTVVVYKPIVPNNPPIFNSAELNEVGNSGDNEIILEPIQTTPLRCFGYLTDADGNVDIENVNATFYHWTSNSQAVDNDDIHYTDSSCSYSTSTGYYECNVDMWWYADPGTWYCNVTAYDGEDINFTTDTANVIYTPANVKFESNPLIIPQYPARTDDLECSWSESEDVENRTVYWYNGGVLDRIEYPSIPSSTISGTQTKNNEEWNCTVLLAGANVTATGSDSVLVGSSPPGSLPVINSIELNDPITGDEVMNLLPGTTEKISCFGIASDADGNTDIVSISANIYSDLVTSTSSDDFLNHYSNSSCSYDSGTGAYDCTVDVYFYANPGTWSCDLTVTDSTSNIVSSSDSATMNSLIALDIPDSSHLNFGNMGVNQQKTNNSLNVSFTNIGNVEIDLQADAWETGGNENSVNAMGCTSGGIPVSYFRGGLIFGSYTTYTSFVTTGYRLFDSNLPRQTSGMTPTNSDVIYFGLQTTGGSGTCNGIISLLAIASN